MLMIQGGNDKPTTCGTWTAAPTYAICVPKVQAYWHSLYEGMASKHTATVGHHSPNISQPSWSRRHTQASSWREYIMGYSYGIAMALEPCIPAHWIPFPSLAAVGTPTLWPCADASSEALCCWVLRRWCRRRNKCKKQTEPNMSQQTMLNNGRDGKLVLSSCTFTIQWIALAHGWRWLRTCYQKRWYGSVYQLTTMVCSYEWCLMMVDNGQ